ncbi:hypothetical protein FP744_10007711 [Trichoderma asperellum]|nr:ankyrin repeat-containing domain protein [Trichoderma asperelloides]
MIPWFFFSVSVMLGLTGRASANGDDFAYDLSSDLGPILALFVERVVMQFMSQGMGIADCILLAMAPIGAITIVVSAIRVAGPMWLRSFIGRERENLSAAEIDIMPSTSKETCELWNGCTLVRCSGSADICQFICLIPKKYDVTTLARKRFNIQFKALEDVEDDAKKTIERGNSEEAGKLEQDIQATEVSNKVLKKFDLLSKEKSHPTSSTGISVENSEAPNLSIHSSRNIIPIEDSENGEKIEMVIISGNLDDSAPNVYLNCHDRVGRGEIYLAAALGIILQLGAILYFGVITYHKPIQYRFLEDGKRVVGYAFPCAVVGSVLLVFGLFICSWVVSESTTETYYQAENHQMFVVWLQRDNSVSYQVFEPYAIYPTGKREYITMSRRNYSPRPQEIRGLVQSILKKLVQRPTVNFFQFISNRLFKDQVVSQNYHTEERMDTEIFNHRISPNMNDAMEEPLCWPLKFITVLGTLISLIGFISQFIGMRGLHWTASLVQLGTTLAVTILRTTVRRGLRNTPASTRLKSAFELDWFALTFGNLATASWANFSDTSYNSSYKKHQDLRVGMSPKWEIRTGHQQTYLPLKEFDRSSDKRIKRINDSKSYELMLVRKELGRLSKWSSPVREEAFFLSRAIEAAANTFLSMLSTEDHKWIIPVAYSTETNEGLMETIEDNIYITITKAGDSRWLVDESEIEAILSLWLYSISSTDHFKTGRQRSLRVYGPSESEEHLIRDLEWWMRENIPKISKYTDEEIFTKEGSDCTVVGFGTEHGGKASAQTGATREYLVLECQDKQQRLFSRDLYFSFMRAVAKMPEVDITGTTSAHPLSSSTMTKGWKQMNLKNDIISDLAERLEKIGFGSLSDIYIDLIIPLSLEYKLTNVKNIIEDITREAHEYEQSQQWEKLVDTCICLLDLALHFDLKKESSAPLAMAVCLGFLYRLHHEAKLQNFERRTEQELKIQLKKLKKRFIRDNQSSAYFSANLPDEPIFLAVSLSILAGPNYNNTTSFPDSFQIAAENLKVIEKSKMEQKLHIQNFKAFEKTDAFGWSLLHYAANLTILDIDNNWQTSDEFPNPQDLMGWTPLHHACFFGNEKMVKMLLKYKAPIEIAGKDGITPMHCAVQSGKAEIVQELIQETGRRYKKHSRKIERHVDRNKRHPIHWAAVEGNVKMVRLMKGDIRLKDRFGWTPLHLAAIYDHKKLLRYITEDHAETINTCDNELRTPLHLAVKGELIDAVQILIQAGARINTVAKNGSTPLHVAVKHKQKEILKMLLKHGTNKNVMDKEGRTPLYLSVEDGDIETINLLIKGGASEKVAAEDGRTPLHVALSRGQDGLEVAKILLQAGADVNAKAQYGATGMHIAAQFGILFEILNFLVEIGKNSLDNEIDETDEYGQTPLLIAIYEADWEAAKLLLARGASVHADKRNGYTPVLGAVIGEQEDILQQLLGKGANVNDEDKDGYSPLHLAVLYRNQNITSLLLGAGASIDTVERSMNDTPIHTAIRNGHTEIVQLLLDRGAHTRLLNDFDFSPLQYALYHGDLPMVKILIEHDKKSATKAASQKNEEGDTPLHTLAECNNDEATTCTMLDELLSIGPEIEINAKNGKGSTPLDLALCEASEHRLFINKLLGRGAEPGSEDGKILLERWKSQNSGLQEVLSE